MAKQWMFAEPLPVLDFVRELHAYDIEKGRCDAGSPQPKLVGFRQSATKWSAQFVSDDGDFFREASGYVAKSREWLRKRLSPEEATDEDQRYAIG